jgi:hypothetical protein
LEQDNPLPRLILAAGMLGLIVWTELPDWQKTLVIASIRQRTRMLVGWLARRSGHVAMGDELAGRDEAASAGYGWAFRLSQLRDRL